MIALTRKVLDHGHRRIGFISFYVQDNDRARERLIGLKETLQDAGLPDDALRVIETQYEVESGGDAFEKMMRSATPPTAVMCGNDVLAVGALRRAREMGLSVPGDVSITGFDDLELARIVTPALTTVHVPHRKMGREAARELVRMVEKKSLGTSTELDTWIVIRESLDRPPC
jgi:LacI family transcriptional regulator